MKVQLLLLAACLLLASPALQAIPQSIGGLFLNASNNPRRLPVEEWFREATHWEPGAPLPGPWVSGTESSGLMLRDPGPVFGIQADSVTVTRDDQKRILEVTVYYTDGVSKIAKADLFKRVSRSVALFNGGNLKKTSTGSELHSGKDFSIALHSPNPGAVVATLKR